MKSFLATSVFIFLFYHIHGQPTNPHARWQQRVAYEMEVGLDVTNHQFSGTQKLTYTNNSPDTLKKVFYHLFFNAFQPGSMMDIRSRNISDPDKRVGNRIASLTPDQIGFLKIEKLQQDGGKISFKEDGTILEVILETPLLPGTSTTFDMEFNGQVPVQIRRSGRNNKNGIAYSMAQWYPKLCEYDPEGWHTNPYIGREFQGVWGDFDVKITLDAAYTVGGTGYLQNAPDIGHGYATAPRTTEEGAPKKLTWHFVAPNVHDFMWAADPDYIHDKVEVPNGPMLHFIYQEGPQSENWKKVQPFAVQVFQLMEQLVGKYPYKQYTIIQGGDGGMEYPMSTLITGNRSLQSLLSTTIHEVAHSWFQHTLASNESLYPWMDEGFASYYDADIMMRFAGVEFLNPHYGSYLSYLNLVKDKLEEPSSTHSDHYQTNRAYSTASYSKGEICLHQLSYIMGETTFQKAMKKYYETWKFQHPTPTDFKRVMEQSSGLELDWYLQYWINTTYTIDYGIEEVSSEGPAKVTLSRIGKVPMPIDVQVTYTDGTKELYYIPLQIMRGEKAEEPFYYPDVPRKVLADWKWVSPTYSFLLPKTRKEVKEIVIDPTYRLADVERKNNFFPKVKKKEYEFYGAKPR